MASKYYFQACLVVLIPFSLSFLLCQEENGQVIFGFVAVLFYSLKCKTEGKQCAWKGRF